MTEISRICCSTGFRTKRCASRCWYAIRRNSTVSDNRAEDRVETDPLGVDFFQPYFRAPVFLAAEERLQPEREEDQPEHEHRERDRTLNENRIIAGAHCKRLAERELEHRREHQSQRDGREIVAEFAQQISHA